jgi:hypothetical protein
MRGGDMKKTAPKWVKMDSRNRVCLYAYRTLEEATIASEDAVKRAASPGYEGFDYGFCTVGAIHQHDGLYWVTFP